MLSSRPPPSHPRTRVKLGYGQCPRPAPSRSDTAGSRPRGRPGRRGRQPALPPVFVEGDHEPGLRERVAPVEAQDVDFAEAGLVAGAAQMDAAIGAVPVIRTPSTACPLATRSGMGFIQMEKTRLLDASRSSLTSFSARAR